MANLHESVARFQREALSYGLEDLQNEIEGRWEILSAEVLPADRVVLETLIEYLFLNKRKYSLLCVDANDPVELDHLVRILQVYYRVFASEEMFDVAVGACCFAIDCQDYFEKRMFDDRRLIWQRVARVVSRVGRNWHREII